MARSNSYSLPVEFNDGIALIPLSTMESIENGDLLITANITGANGAGNSAQFFTPIVLSPPEILSIDLCQNGEEIDQLMFGQTADAVVRVRSSRQVSDVTASLEQLGWIVSAPSQGAADCGNDLAEQDAAYHFRIQLDSPSSLEVAPSELESWISMKFLLFIILVSSSYTPPRKSKILIQQMFHTHPC